MPATALKIYPVLVSVPNFLGTTNYYSALNLLYRYCFHYSQHQGTCNIKKYHVSYNQEFIEKKKIVCSKIQGNISKFIKTNLIYVIKFTNYFF